MEFKPQETKKLNIILCTYIAWSILLLEYSAGALAEQLVGKAHDSTVLGDPSGEAGAGIAHHVREAV